MTDNVPQTPSRQFDSDKVNAGSAGVDASTPQTQYVVTPEESPDTSEFPEAIPYDEEVPVYWDMAAQTYYYYGYPVAYDEDQESYYYWSHESQEYLYIDQDTLDQINANQIYSYNNDTGEYLLEAGDEEEAGEEEAAGEEEEAGEEEAGEEEEEEAGEEAGDEGAVKTGEWEEEVIEQVEVEDSGEADTNAISANDQSPGEKIELPSAGLYGMTNMAEDPFAAADASGASTEMSPSMQAMLKHVIAMSAPSNNADKFPNSIDFFNDSYQNVGNRGHKMLHDICSEDPSVLDEYKQRPNGTYVIGRCKRTVDGLIKGNLELKSLAATEVSSVASVLQNLSLPQLVYMRQNAQNSPWLKSPQASLKSFAEKCDDSIGEKLIHFMLARAVGLAGDAAPAAEERNKKLLKKMGPMNVRQCGTWTVFCLGALTELSAAKERILGTDGLKEHWWWQTAGSTTGSTMLKGDCDENDVKGIFVRIQKDPTTGHVDLRAQFDCPKSETGVINRLIAGRGDSYIRWDVTEVSIF